MTDFTIWLSPIDGIMEGLREPLWRVPVEPVIPSLGSLGSLSDAP